MLSKKSSIYPKNLELQDFFCRKHRRKHFRTATQEQNVAGNSLVQKIEIHASNLVPYLLKQTTCNMEIFVKLFETGLIFEFCGKKTIKNCRASNETQCLIGRSLFIEVFGKFELFCASCEYTKTRNMAKLSSKFGKIDRFLNLFPEEIIRNILDHNLI